MHVPEPVSSLLSSSSGKGMDNMGRRFLASPRKTQRSAHTDEEIRNHIAGMGELHLDVYVERMRREYSCDVETGRLRLLTMKPSARPLSTTTRTRSRPVVQVSSSRSGYDGANRREGLHLRKPDCWWYNSKGIHSICREGFQELHDAGEYIGFPVQGIRFTLTDGTRTQLTPRTTPSRQLPVALSVTTTSRRSHRLLSLEGICRRSY